LDSISHWDSHYTLQTRPAGYWTVCMIENDRRYIFFFSSCAKKRNVQIVVHHHLFLLFSLSLRKFLLDIIDERKRDRKLVKWEKDETFIHTYIYVNVYCLYFRIKEKEERECTVVHPSIHIYISNNLYIVRSKNNHKEENDDCWLTVGRTILKRQE